MALLLQGEMKKAVFAYWDGGYLDRCDEGSYGYGMVGVLKPDGSARICGDLSTCNRRIRGQRVYLSFLSAKQEALDDNVTESSPHYAEFDRRMLVSKALTSMQEVRFHAISSGAAAAAQVVLANA